MVIAIKINSETKKLIDYVKFMDGITIIKCVENAFKSYVKELEKDKEIKYKDYIEFCNKKK